ncbi:MAG: hypothetical protein H9W81_21965 [Enterococcus sp.]|nr:hypothetical protein [Enterococcus sp.]
MTKTNERMPYWFSKDQIDCLARSVGSSIENGNGTLGTINDEIGIATARTHTSGIRAKLPKIFKEEKFVLMLSDEECFLLTGVALPADIKEVLNGGL